MNREFFNSQFDSTVESEGWRRILSGNTRACNYDEQFAVYVKATPVAEIFKNSAKRKCEKAAVSSKKDTPSKTVMEYLRGNGRSTSSFVSLEELTDTYSLNSYFLNDMKSVDFNFVIRAECCWVTNPSNIISYNFSFIYCGYAFSFIFLIFDDVIKALPLDVMLGRIFDFLDYKRTDRRKVTSYEYIPELDKKGKPVIRSCAKHSDALSKGRYVFINGKPTSNEFKAVGSEYKPSLVHKKYDFTGDKLNVTLLLYHGLQFFSSLNDSSYILNNLNIREHGKGLFSTKPIMFNAVSLVNKGWNYTYPVCLTIRDAVNHDCIGDATPSQFGECAKCRQTDFSDTELGKDFELRLDEYITSYPSMYLNYAAQRNTDVLMYMSVIWGFNRFIPFTLTSAACSLAKEQIAEHLGCVNDAEYLCRYSGTVHFKGNLLKTAREKFCRRSSNMPLNDDCDIIQRYSAKSYRGGYNGCMSVDCHNGINTYDLDISGAYPTSMALIPAIDWNDCIDFQFTRGQKLSLADFAVDGEITPFAPVFASVTYKFPDDCRYPCLPRNGEDDDEAPAYPLEEDRPVYCSGPELYLALKLGADITVSSGYKAKVLHDSDGNIIYPYRSIVTALVKARAEAEKAHGKKSFQAKLLKLVVNMLYGKTAQQVSQLYSSGSNDKGDESPITNPVSATMTTSFIRAVLFAAFHDIEEAGYEVYSATTDGLITNAPFDEFIGFDLFGLNAYLLESRKIITEQADPDTWSVKHEQDNLVNLTTRGNASLTAENKMLGIMGGVFAKNGVSTAYPDAPKECAQNREAFIKAVAGRKGKIPTEFLEYPTLKDIRNGGLYKRDRSFRCINMDYDMKRKPVRSSLRAEQITIDGETFEIAHIETEPYRDSEELKFYRSVKERMTCLRTVAEWEQFFDAVEMRANGRSRLPSTGIYDWSVLCACIIGYRAGLWDIPYLDTPGLTVAEKCAWINSFNGDGEHTYSKKHWDKASEKAVQAKCLPQAVVHPLLLKLQKANTR